jgi:hypothetical protein
MDRIYRINKIVIPAKAGIPFPRVRGKVGWGHVFLGPRLRGDDDRCRVNPVNPVYLAFKKHAES